MYEELHKGLQSSSLIDLIKDVKKQILAVGEIMLQYKKTGSSSFGLRLQLFMLEHNYDVFVLIAA